MISPGLVAPWGPESPSAWDTPVCLGVSLICLATSNDLVIATLTWNSSKILACCCACSHAQDCGHWPVEKSNVCMSSMSWAPESHLVLGVQRTTQQLSMDDDISAETDVPDTQCLVHALQDQKHLVVMHADSFVYLPTQCRMLLDLICHARPNHHLIIGDFDELPDVQVPGKNAPLVASKVWLLPLTVRLSLWIGKKLTKVQEEKLPVLPSCGFDDVSNL